MNIHFKIIEKEAILTILPLLQQLNTATSLKILEKRVLEMATYPNYECIGAFHDKKLIGVSGLWYATRHYSGKSVEPDHVIIDESYRGNNIGELLFNFIETHTKLKGCEAVELNTYTGNTKSHKFYYNQGYKILGFHFIKVIKRNK